VLGCPPRSRPVEGPREWRQAPKARQLDPLPGPRSRRRPVAGSSPRPPHGWCWSTYAAASTGLPTAARTAPRGVRMGLLVIVPGGRPAERRRAVHGRPADRSAGACPPGGGDRPPPGRTVPVRGAAAGSSRTAIVPTTRAPGSVPTGQAPQNRRSTRLPSPRAVHPAASGAGGNACRKQGATGAGRSSGGRPSGRATAAGFWVRRAAAVPDRPAGAGSAR